MFFWYVSLYNEFSIISIWYTCAVLPMDIYVVLCRPIQLNSFQSLHRFAFCLSLALSVSHFRSLSLQPQLSLFISNKHKMNKWIIKWLQVITFKLYVCFILKNPHCNAWFLMQRFDFFIFVCAHIFQAIKHAMPLICHTKRKWFAVLFFSYVLFFISFIYRLFDFEADGLRRVLCGYSFDVRIINNASDW